MPDKIELTPLGLREAFATLTAGSVDVLTHRFTWTFNRDNGAGIETVLPVFYDGQGFIVRKSAGIKNLNELNGATICVTQGSTTELNLADYFRSHKLTYQLATFADPDETRNAYDAGRCDAWTNDRGSLAARSLGAQEPRRQRHAAGDDLQGADRAHGEDRRHYVVSRRALDRRPP